MHPAAQMAWALALVALLLTVLQKSGWVLAPAAVERAFGPRTPDEGGEDEQLPETDRAPRRGLSALACAIAVTAAVRFGLLIAIHR